MSDLADTEVFSTEEWGKRAATRYLKDIESSLGLIADNPGILRSIDGLPPELRFHRVNKHWLVCDGAPGSIVVLTMIPGSVDAPARIAELVPQLAAESSLLHGQLRSDPRTP